MVVDLSGVGFAGSAALGNFTSLHRIVRQNGGRIVFCDVDPTVLDVFRVSKLDNLFDFVANRAAALRAITDHPGANKSERMTPATNGNGPVNAPRGSSGPLRRRNSQSDPH